MPRARLPHPGQLKHSVAQQGWFSSNRRGLPQHQLPCKSKLTQALLRQTRHRAMQPSLRKPKLKPRHL